MVTFLNTETGKTVHLAERWARRLRGKEYLRELDANGEEVPSEPTPIQEADPALKRLRIADLRSLAEEKGLSTEGSKAALVARLSE
jgi:SAP domain-containing protein